MRVAGFAIAGVCALAAFAMSACDMAGGGKVTPVVKRGPPAAALESPVDVERVAALVPKDNSYANKTTSISLTISGTCISQSVAVKVSVVNAEVKVTLDCDATSGAFASELDLSAVPDGEVQIGFGFLKSRDSTAPIYELTRIVIKDTEDLPAFTVPASLSESNSGTIAISEVAGAAMYRTTFTPQGGGAAVGPIETTLPAVPVTGLTVGTTYDVTVAALDAAGNETTASNTGTFAKSAPPNPTGLTATAASSSQIDLSWTSGGGSTAGYKIAYKSGGTAPTNCASGAGVTVIPSSSITGTSRSVSGFNASTQYSFRVCAVNNDTTPAVSSGVTASATTLLAVAPNPTTPSATAVSTTQIDLTWVNAGGTTQGFRIAYQTGATAPATCAAGTPISEGSITGTSHPVTGLSGGTQYSFRICAINANATPDVSSGVTVTQTTFQVAPPNPTGPTATAASSTRIDLSWTSGGGSTTDYRISYQTGASAPADCTTGTIISESSVTGTSHSVTGLTSSTQYAFRICAINGNATPDVSSGVTATATTSAPALVAVLSGTPAAKSSALALDVTVSGTDVTRYKFALDLASNISCANSGDYSSISQDGWDQVGAKITNSLLPDGNYLLCVVGGDSSGNWQPFSSATSHAWTKETVAPTAGSWDTSTSVSSSGFTLNWTAATDPGSTASELSYYVCRGDNDADIDTVEKCEAPSTPGVYMVMNWTSNILTKSVASLSASTTYYFRVIVKDAAGNKTLYAAKSETTSAAGAGPVNGDIQLSYFNNGSSAVGYLYGGAGGTYTDNSNFGSGSTGYTTVGAGITLDGSNAPWIAFSLSNGGGDVETKVSGTSFSGTAITSSNVYETNGDTAIAWIKDAGSPHKYLAVSGWSTGDVNDFKISHLFNQMTNLTTGFASQLPVIENPATFPSPVPRGYSVATDSGFSGHYVGVDTSSESRLMYFTYDGSFHQQTAGGLLNTLSDGSLMCATSSFPAIGFDRSTSAHGLHIVYYCVPGGAAANEIVHLFYDGSAWKRSLVTQVTMAVPSSTPGNSRLGFAVHDGRAIVVYWNANGDMTYQIGTFNAGIYSWGMPVGFDTQSAGVTYHTPQAAMGSGSLVRVAYVVYDTTGVTPESRIRLVYETQINSWDVSILKSFQHATNRLFLGLGLGITGMAGNSAR